MEDVGHAELLGSADAGEVRAALERLAHAERLQRRLERERALEPHLREAQLNLPPLEATEDVEELLAAERRLEVREPAFLGNDDEHRQLVAVVGELDGFVARAFRIRAGRRV